MLAELTDKIKRLKTLYETVGSEKERILREKEELAATVKEKDEKIKELKKKIEVLLLAKAVEISSADRQDARQKIEKIVREIEKCIAMLNN
jgi:chromosome segregation ATPase